MQTTEGLRAPDIGTIEQAVFPAVFLLRNISLKMLPRSAAAFKLLPYDAYCPSVQGLLVRQVCNKCGLYHASMSSLKSHLRQSGIVQPVLLIHPVRIAARRQRELMAVMLPSTNLKI